MRGSISLPSCAWAAEIFSDRERPGASRKRWASVRECHPSVELARRDSAARREIWSVSGSETAHETAGRRRADPSGERQSEPGGSA
jgi:hypothetical protein